MGIGTEIHIGGTVVSDSGINGISYAELSVEDKIVFHKEWANVFMQVERFDLAGWNLAHEIDFMLIHIIKKHCT